MDGSMATDECLGVQAHGRTSALIQNGDWTGSSPHPRPTPGVGFFDRDITHPDPHFVAERARCGLLTGAAKW
jgi:hypothetical protein